MEIISILFLIIYVPSVPYLDKSIQIDAIQTTPRTVQIISRFSLLLAFVVVNELVINERWRCPVSSIRVSINKFVRG